MSSEEPSAATSRDPQPVHARGAELRTDPLTGQQVIMAPGRSLRPHAFDPEAKGESAPAYVETCPLCPGNEHQTPPTILTLTRPGSQTWAVRVVSNLYPIVSAPGSKLENGEGPAPSAATGVHELVIETPEHNRDLPDRDAEEMRLLLEAFAQRLSHLEGRRATKHVVIFKNHGAEAGASLQHPHSQIAALDFVPLEVRRRVRAARRYLEANASCVVCDIVRHETEARTRIVRESDEFLVFAPYASLTAGQVLVVPRIHAPSFGTASRVQREDLGRVLPALLGRVRDAFAGPSYNLVLHTAPKRSRNDAALHWYWELTPRLTRTGGLELGTGLAINTMLPEDVAALLRP
jgi:UDPglucose--hexose-1-phosphate uridylyltransferase